MTKTRTPAIGALLALLLFCGCSSSRWKYVRERPKQKMVTTVTVKTIPPGAEISVNGQYQGKSPIRVPVRYSYVVRIYERREALPYLHVEEREVPTYQNNVFRFGALLIDYAAAEESVAMSGQKEKEVVIRLRPR